MTSQGQRVQQPQLSPINNRIHGNTAEKKRIQMNRGFLAPSDEEMKLAPIKVDAKHMVLSQLTNHP